MTSENKKRQMKTGCIVGLIVGIFMFILFGVVTKRWVFSAFIIPVAGLVGLAQGYLSPELDE